MTALAESSPAPAPCPRCGRPDCLIVERVITGTVTYLRALAECFAVARRNARKAPR